MANHAALWVACCARCVDQDTAFARLLLVHLGLNDFVLYRASSLQEILPQEESRAGHAFGQCTFSPDDEGLDPVIFIKIDCELLELLSIFDANDLCLRVSGLIEARISLVGDVDASVDLVVHDASHEGDGPLR